MRKNASFISTPQTHTYASKRGKKTRVKVFLEGAALCLSLCVSCNAREISRTCTTVLQEHHQKTSKFLSTLQLGIFLTGTELSFNAFQSRATSNKQVPHINGIWYIRPLKACIGLNVAAAQWRFTIMKPYLHRVGGSLTPPHPISSTSAGQLRRICPAGSKKVKAISYMWIWTAAWRKTCR